MSYKIYMHVGIYTPALGPLRVESRLQDPALQRQSGFTMLVIHAAHMFSGAISRF